jgi:hypothetical protein
MNTPFMLVAIVLPSSLAGILIIGYENGLAQEEVGSLEEYGNWR